MLSEEEMAINRLECGNTAHSRNADYIQLAIKALKKQVPMKVSVSKYRNDYDWFCNKCNTTYQYNRYTKTKPLYCEFCGQKLDWGD